jgi:hypothetical protein
MGENSPNLVTLIPATKVNSIQKPRRPSQSHCQNAISAAQKRLAARVARWFVFKPKIPNLGKFWRAFEW